MICKLSGFEPARASLVSLQAETVGNGRKNCNLLSMGMITV